MPVEHEHRVTPRERWCDEDCRDCPHNFEPKYTLEISDCHDRIQLQFDLESEAERQNSLHKLDVLIAALRVFRVGIEAEQAEYERRSGSSPSRRAK